MESIEVTQRRIKKEVENRLGNFMFEPINSNTLHAIEDSVSNSLRGLVQCGLMQDGYKVEVSPNQTTTDSINVSITIKYGIQYKQLELNWPSHMPDLVSEILGEIKGYDIDEILDNI